MKIRILTLIITAICCLIANAQTQDTVTVARDGSGQYRNIQDAINRVRAFMEYDVVIYIKSGTYKEKLVVPSWIKNVHLVGEDVNNTIITYDDHANINNMGTFRTYSMKVEANDIVCKNLTIQNNAEPLGQAVALHTEGTRLVFINCRFLGNQDTIYTGSEEACLYFEDCYVEGTTDFIFGPSTAVFDNCTIHSKRNSYITAASTAARIKYGYVFLNCKLTAAEGVNQVYLGRPWRPNAATAFINCEMGKHIRSEGWENWRDPENEKTARYAEYGNTGEGAKTSGRVKWSRVLSKEEAAQYTLENIFGTNNKWWLVDCSLLTIFMIGDSTMADKNLEGGNPERGWGQLLPEYFDRNKVIVDNHAQNGRSSKSFIDEGRWDAVVAKIKKGDYVFIQFGHNDEKADSARHTVPGTTFDENLRRFVREARTKGGIPVLFNSIVRRNFNEEGMLVDTHGAYLDSPRSVARQMGTVFIDMNKITHDLVQNLGAEDSKKLFVWVNGKEDNTHLNEYGARLIAGLTAEAIGKEIPELGDF